MTTSGAHITLVEDDPKMAEVLTDVLSDVGHHVTHVSTGTAALESIERHPPDLLLLDLGLPDVDGLWLCSTIRARTNAPIIICSANASIRDRVLGLRLGADDFVAKPFDVDDLEARVDAVLRRSSVRLPSPHSNEAGLLRQRALVPPRRKPQPRGETPQRRRVH